ncbi:hypothetical protein PVK06_009124 [Gossypium arboreum]|uniref:Gag/pol protein n=1 Tax=Gossypium arboreum TaxID=29729 RepID=A0ABR0QLL3_GOSAR|nr:hypothetical protein PVK06_009124 [Gossypium arboreum]
MMFKSLLKDFVGFRAVYNLGNKSLMLTQLIKELQSYELMLNDGQLVQRAKANIIITSSLKEKGMQAKKGKTKVSRQPQVKGKRTRKPKDLSKSKCFFYSKKGNLKANCKWWKEYLSIKGKGVRGDKRS